VIPVPVPVTLVTFAAVYVVEIELPCHVPDAIVPTVSMFTLSSLIFVAPVVGRAITPSEPVTDVTPADEIEVRISASESSIRLMVGTPGLEAVSRLFHHHVESEYPIDPPPTVIFLRTPSDPVKYRAVPDGSTEYTGGVLTSLVLAENRIAGMLFTLSDSFKTKRGPTMADREYMCNESR
jgi:hypothetical protein